MKLRTSLNSKHAAVRGIMAKFMAKEENFLKIHLKVPAEFQKVVCGRNRGELPYSEKGIRAKQKAVAKLRNSLPNSGPLVARAAAGSLRRSSPRSRKIGKLMEHGLKSPNRPKRMLELMRIGRKAENQSNFTPEEGLGLLLKLSLTVEQWKILRKAFRDKGHKKILPPYYLVASAKEKCHPAGIVVHEDSAEIPLQNLLRHTAERIVEVSRPVFVEDLTRRGQSEVSVSLIASWGMDGCSGQSEYKQKAKDSATFDDSNLFGVSVLPLRLYSREVVTINKNKL